MATRRPQANELSSREDFIIQQFEYMKKLNAIARDLYDLYYIDVDRSSELSPMMRTMVPSYYIDPMNPEHPSCYMIPGKSSQSYLERMLMIHPYMDSKNKYFFDLSAWRGLVINAQEFHKKGRGFRKTRLEPLVIMTEQNGERYANSLVLREGATSAKGEYIIPFLQLPNRKSYGEDAFRAALKQLVYEPFYQYLTTYLERGGLPYTAVPAETIEDLVDTGIADFVTVEGDRITVTKNIFPSLASKKRPEETFFVARVPNPAIDVSGGRYHYIVMQCLLNEFGVPYATVYTLLAAMQLT
jgi:hypothetical protein